MTATMTEHLRLEVTDPELRTMVDVYIDGAERLEREEADEKSFRGTLAIFEEMKARPPTTTCTQCGTPAWRAICGDCEDKAKALRDRQEWLSWAPLRLRWATFDAPELAQRVRDAKAIVRAKEAAEARPRSIVFMGPAGVGKSSLAVATVNAMRVERYYATPSFVDALALSTARQRARLGDEAEDVADAMRAHLLVFDELGRGRASQWDATPDVLLARYNDDLPTIFTTPCPNVDDLRARLADDGLARRVLEGATVIVMTAKGGK